MRLSQIEPAAPGYDVRTFECAKCDSSVRFFGRYLKRNSYAVLDNGTFG
jgi:hypothetical protein